MAEVTTKRAFWKALSYAWQFGYTITVPLVVFALGGRFLDRSLGTSPWLLIGGIILSMVLSSILLVRKAMQIMKDVETQSTDTPSTPKS